MVSINIDRSKVSRMVRETLSSFDNSGAHPAEVVLALAEACGKVIASLGESTGGSVILQKELLDLSIKHMASSIRTELEKDQMVLL